MDDLDLQILERHLDAQLDDAGLRELETRLIAEPNLRRLLDELRGQRALRDGFFSSLVPDDAAVDRLMLRVRSAIARRQRIHAAMSLSRWATAAAACIAIGFFAGRILRDPGQKPAVHANSAASPAPHAPSRDRSAGAGNATEPVVYDVAITDETGAIIGIQKFDSLERARQFSQDLEDWQQRLEQLRTGQIIIRSAAF